MRKRIILALRRCEQPSEEGLHTFSGYLEVRGTTAAYDGRYQFDAQPYREAVKHLVVWAQKFEDAELFWLRLEQKPVPIAMEIEGRLSDLLRKDPVAFMRQMDPMMGRPQKLATSMSSNPLAQRDMSTATLLATLPAGYDTLAAAFGDDVYIRRRDDKYESPISGRWVQLGDIGVWTVGVNASWGCVAVANLLGSTDAQRFFLPRPWNRSGPWISREHLQKKYDDFIKERQDVSDTASTRRSDDSRRTGEGSE